jgi:outer membrane protein assembly factor BamD (BamD/ComL family)
MAAVHLKKNEREKALMALRDLVEKYSKAKYVPKAREMIGRMESK